MSGGGDSDSPSVDGNYIFKPPKDETDHPDRPRLEPLDLGFHQDGSFPAIPQADYVRCPKTILPT